MISGRTEQAVRIAPEGLPGDLVMPAGAGAIVLFAHSSGRSRRSLRNRYVAAALRDAGFGTLLMELLTAAEVQIDALTGRLRFDIDFLARRLLKAIDWLQREPATSDLPIGYFGASTGAAAALTAAAARPSMLRAVVSRGGRPDLARKVLPEVQAPTLLIVGGEDRQIIEWNHAALAALHCEKHFTIVPGATHLFEEPGALEQVAESAAGWFRKHLIGASRG